MEFSSWVGEIERLRMRIAGGGPLPGPHNLVLLPVAASTNSLAKEVAADLEAEGLDLAPTLILALAQTGGRGRQGRSWSSPRGRGVYATLTRPLPVGELPALPLLVGVGLCRALSPLLPGGCRLKWPNDLVAPAAGPPLPPEAAPGAGGSPGWSKIGGILIETLLPSGAAADPADPVYTHTHVHAQGECAALIGFGVNFSHRAEDLPPGATSLALLGAALASGVSEGAAVSGESDSAASGLAELTWRLVQGIEGELARGGDLAYAAAAYRELSMHRPGDRLVCGVGGGRRVAGTFAGFDESGRLRLTNAVELAAEEPAGAVPVPAAGAITPEAGDEMVLSAGEVIAG